MLEFDVGKEKGSSRYFVYATDDPKKVPLTELYATKKRALHVAAEMCFMDYKDYMRVRRKEKRDDISDN